jgi:Dehydratase family
MIPRSSPLATRLLRQRRTSLPCIGDGRQSGTSGSPSILNASPEAAASGGLALLKTGDRVRIDLNRGTADILISPAELAERRPVLLITMVILWLAIIFASFGYRAPRNTIVTASFFLAALLISAAIYLILDMVRHLPG